MSLNKWFLMKGISFDLKRIEEKDVMIKYIVPELKKQGMQDIKTNLVSLFKDWIKELEAL